MELTTRNRSAWMSLEEARHAMATGSGKDIRIAIIDSGVEIDHPQLEGLRLVDDIHIVDSGIQVEVKEGDGTDVYGHGTAVASIIRKIAPEAQLGSFRVLGERLNSRTVIIREGVRQAIDKGYHILNCSFGCGVRDHIFQYKDWIDEAYLKGLHVVAACNNMDFNIPEWPGYFPTVITVNMASTTDETRIFYKKGNLVEFAARGVDVPAAWRQHRSRAVTGSSFATPLVAALLARILSATGNLSPLEAKALLNQLADDWTAEIRPGNVSAE